MFDLFAFLLTLPYPFRIAVGAFAVLMIVIIVRGIVTVVDALR